MFRWIELPYASLAENFPTLDIIQSGLTSSVIGRLGTPTATFQFSILVGTRSVDRFVDVIIIIARIISPSFAVTVSVSTMLLLGRFLLFVMLLALPLSFRATVEGILFTHIILAIAIVPSR